MRKIFLLLLLISLHGCGEKKERSEVEESTDTIDQPEEKEYKVLDSRFIFQDSLWAPYQKALNSFSQERYIRLRGLILDANIPQLQQYIREGAFSYRELALFYLYRINRYDRNGTLSLNSVIALNPDLLAQAEAKDNALGEGLETPHPIFGIPVLLKDNINTSGMATTAGSLAMRRNRTEDAFIVERLKSHGALILGKANLSEWAYFFCGDCPSGYSALGGQTLNPYGRKIFDTGGSSSGSAVAVAAGLVPVAVGSETSGSILSPSSQNSVVGLKPTVGLLSRGGIIPISSTLDTPGPITRSVVDNAILLSAMIGSDPQDPASQGVPALEEHHFNALEEASLKGKRFGAIQGLMEDSLYVQALRVLEKAGARIIPYEAPKTELPDFIRLLNLDMKKDLPEYLRTYGGNTGFSGVEDVVRFNIKDSSARMPYGQALFEGILQDTATTVELRAIKDTLSQKGKAFFEQPMEQHQLDGVLSINNFHAGFAAVAHFPAITVPMGYTDEGQPRGLTLITRPFGEQNLLQWAAVFEQKTTSRVPPEKYQE